MILLSSSLNSFIQLLGAVLIFLFVLVLTYFTSKWIGTYQRGSMMNKNLQVLESVKIGANKYICLIQAGKVYLVVAVGKDEVTMLAQLTEEQLSEIPEFEQKTKVTESVIAAENFQEILEKVKNVFRRNRN